MPYTETALTTVKNVQDWLNVPEDLSTVQASGTTLNDTFQRMILGASQFLVSKINRRTLFAADFVTKLSGDGGDVIAPPVWPINSVTSLTINGVIIPSQPSVNYPGYVFDVDCLYLIGYCFPVGVKNIEISWNLGLPQDHPYVAILEEACLALINYRWSHHKHPDQSTEKSQQFLTQSYTDKDVPPEVQDAIDLISNNLPYAY